MHLNNKIILVTGASRGIGRAIAIALKKSGAIVYGTGTSETSITPLENEGVKPVVLDVRDRDAVFSAIENIIAEEGRLDTLVNNAGIAANTPAGNMKPEEIDAIIDTNFKGLFYACQAYYKAARKQGGNIINVASVLGLVGTPLASVYSGTKGAVIQLTKTLAIEWARNGFRVNSICPGMIDTDMTEAFKKRPEVLKKVEENIPMKRLGKPEEIAGWAVFLASDMASYATGGCYVVDGGLTAQ